MRKEIYALCNQLLYYVNSKMNLHTKLSHCRSYTKSIRREMQIMLNEWYQDAEQAIDHFKASVGTAEAYSFAETIRALRMNEHDSYYDLLRQRIQDYKTNIKLEKEGRKETASYILFVLAGIPIINTFWVFLFPWVEEGKKLFDSLGS